VRVKGLGGACLCGGGVGQKSTMPFVRGQKEGYVRGQDPM